MNAPDQADLFAHTQAPSVASHTDQRLICFNCLGETTLREVVKTSGTPGACAVCGKSKNALPIAQIAEHLDKLITKLYYGVFPDYEEQEPGTNLRSVVREVLSQEHACEDEIIEALKSNERNGSGDGSFYSDTAVYERRQAAMN